MRHFGMVMTILLLGVAALCNDAGAQLPSNPAAPVTGMKPDRTTADPATRQAMQQKEAALRQKRAECGRQAKARKLYFAKRSRFVAECMTR